MLLLFWYAYNCTLTFKTIYFFVLIIVCIVVFRSQNTHWIFIGLNKINVYFILNTIFKISAIVTLMLLLPKFKTVALFFVLALFDSLQFIAALLYCILNVSLATSVPLLQCLLN
jgi:hypothetical protein